jgi:hypothetical protein
MVPLLGVRVFYLLTVPRLITGEKLKISHWSEFLTAGDEFLSGENFLPGSHTVCL